MNSFRSREPKSLDAYLHYREGMRLTSDLYHSDFQPSDLAAAIKELEMAIELDPEYSLAYWALGNAYEAKYNFSTDRKNPEHMEKMHENYMLAHKANPDIGETNLGLGWSFYNRGDNEEAFPWFMRAQELDPRNPIVNEDVGAFLRSIGLYSQAIKFFEKALKSNPLYLSPRIQIAACQTCIGKFKKASRQLKRVLDKDPENLTALDLYASQLVMMDKLDKAEEQINKALSILGKNPNTMFTSQLLLWAAQGKKELVLSSIPEDQKISVDTTFAYLLLGMKDQAIQNIREGIEKGFQETGDYLYSYSCLAENPIFHGIRANPRFQELLLLQERKYERELNLYRAR
jgi:Tfp pilus assembly protein PilF